MTEVQEKPAWWEKLISKSSFANISATVLVVGGFVYAYNTQDTNLMTVMVGAGIGYLLGVKSASK